MKNYLRVLLLILFTSFAFSLAAAAEETYIWGDYTYSLEDGGAVISKYTGNERDVVIPDTINGYPVKAIGADSFHKVEELKSVVLPEGVEIVRDNAFSACSELTSVILPKSLKSFGIRVFNGCKSLAEITVAPGSPLFETMDGVLFQKVDKMLCVYPAAKVDPTYTVPQGTVSIAFLAFSGNNALTEITFPSSVENIESGAFAGCNNLMHISVSPENRAYGSLDGVLYNKAENTLTCYPAAKPEEKYCIRNGTLAIADMAFSECLAISRIDIPESVTAIGERAFKRCRSLSIVNIPGGVTVMERGVFSECDSLKKITLPDGITEIGPYAFDSCRTLAEVFIPAGVSAIHEAAFANCRSLKEIPVSPDNPYYESRDGVLFDKQKKLLLCYPAGKEDTDYQIPSGTLAVENFAFYWCRNLKSIAIPEGVVSIGHDAFFGCLYLETITIPGTVQEIGDHAFFDCAMLRSIVIPRGVTRIGPLTFSPCHSLESVVIPDTVTEIGDGAFAYCSSLKTLSVPDSVTSIGKAAFSYCIKLRLEVGKDSYAMGYAQENGIAYEVR